MFYTDHYYVYYISCCYCINYYYYQVMFIVVLLIIIICYEEEPGYLGPENCKIRAGARILQFPPSHWLCGRVDTAVL